ncbi:MAG TPA: DJ-1/PfpI family protein [Candidatus Baltobacteraceae bacterium]|jgi:transcriptional regulator GlxA family with amidase domain
MLNRRAAALLALSAPWLTREALAKTPLLRSRPDTIAMLVYDNMQALDFVAPHAAFTFLRGAKVHVVAKTRDPVVSDSGLRFFPTLTLSECPKDLTVLFVPGGIGTLDAMRDEETVAFIADRGARASYVTSVCTGSMLLGAAGLLRGYRATTHWSVLDVLEHFGARSVRKRVVSDRNRITGGGVTAGLDFGLAMIAEMRDRFYAQTVQLMFEYNPQPPFDAGSPLTAPSAVVAEVREILADFISQANALS